MITNFPFLKSNIKIDSMLEEWFGQKITEMNREKSESRTLMNIEITKKEVPVNQQSEMVPIKINSKRTTSSMIMDVAPNSARGKKPSTSTVKLKGESGRLWSTFTEFSKLSNSSYDSMSHNETDDTSETTEVGFKMIFCEWLRNAASLQFPSQNPKKEKEKEKEKLGDSMTEEHSERSLAGEIFDEFPDSGVGSLDMDFSYDSLLNKTGRVTIKSGTLYQIINNFISNLYDSSNSFWDLIGDLNSFLVFYRRFASPYQLFQLLMRM